MKLDVILKWAATTTLVIGSAVNSLGYYPLGPLILIAGGSIWLTVSIMWKEVSLIVTNLVMTLVAIIGLGYHYLG